MLDHNKLINIFKASPTPTSIVSADDPHFSFVQMNDAYLEMTEREQEDLIGRSIFEAFPANPDEESPTGVDRLRSSFQKVLKTKKKDQMNDIRYDITLKDGTYREFYWRIENVPVFNKKGNVEFIINSAINITEQRLNQREYELMLNNAEDSFVLLDRDKKIINFNDAYAEKTMDIFGKKPEVGMSIMEFALPERVDKVNEILNKVFKGEVIKADLSMTNKDGRNRYFHTTYRPAILESGYIYGALFSVYEKTEELHIKKELEINEARFRALVETGNDVLFILSPNAKPSYISPSIENVLGYSQQEAYEIDLMQVVHPDDLSIIFSELEKCMDKPGIPLEVTPARMKHKNGSYRWFEGTITNMLHDPAINGIVDIFRDITDRVEYQETIAETKEKFRNVVEHSTNMFYQHDVNGVIDYVSPQSIAFLGCSPEEAKRSWTDFITNHPINREGEKLTQKAIETGEVQEPYELQLISKDNRIIWVEVNEAPLKKDDKVVGIVGSLTDITDRKKYEKQLKQSLERYDYVSKASRDAIYDWDITNNIIHWGEGFTTLFGHKSGKSNYPLENWEKLVHSGDQKETMRDLNFTLKDISMNKWVCEYRLKKAKGGYAYVVENGYIIRNEDGKAIRMIGALKDITDQKQNEEEIKASLSEKETLLAEIHHRVKNNLAVVSGMMQLQAFESDNPELQEKLYDSVVRIKTMATVHELLYQSNSFSKLEFSDTLKKLVENVSETLQPEHPIDLDIHCDPITLNINQAIPASLIVNEVITNAYKHAFKDRENGKIVFSLKEEEDQVNIEISDNGAGIPEGKLEKGGSLGLHLINVLCDQINGCGEYENNGNGTTFTLSFEKQEIKTGIGNATMA